ncbi:MAG: T9SS type A sorting domain-containing protein, partial [bacterium]
PTLSPNKQVVTWEIGDLPPNSSGYITLMVNANTEGYANQQDMYNKVTISSQQPDSNPNNNYAECKTRVVNPVTNLHVIKHGPKQVSPGKEMTYTIHYGNAGNTAAKNIEIVDTLDKGVTYMGSDIDYKYPPQVIGNKIIWRIPKIRHGFNTNFDVRVLVAGNISKKVLCNEVEITVLPTDHNPKNNSSKWETRVVEQKADLSVVISADIARPGFKKNLYVTCTNEGTGKAENVVVTLSLPDKNHATYDYSCPQGDYNSSLNTITWSVGCLPAGESKHYRAKIAVKTPAPRGTRLYSQATVSTTSPESDSKNNTAKEHEDVITSYDPNMKTSSPQDYVPATATAISYTIHFENIGQANATKIKLDDQLTDNLDWNTVAIKDVCVGGTVSTVSEFNTQLRKKLQDKLKPLVPSQYTKTEVDEIVEMSGLRVWWHPSMGTITWEFDFGDYEFGLPPNNPLDEGTGWVRFAVNTIGTLTSGTEIENKATIKFDYNEPINTPVVKHIVDGSAPVSQITLDPYQVNSTFTVGWIGTDTVGKIDNYEVYAAQDNGTPTLWGSFVENSASYVGIVGSTYTFSCKARDMAGNVGSMSSAVSTRVLPPATEAGTLTRVIISPASGSMELGETRTLTAQGLNENGEVMAGISYSWGTSTGFAVIGTPTNAITVKAIGAGNITMRVTAVKNAASATTTGTYTISIGSLDRITIEGTPTSMELNQQTMFVGHGFNKFGAEIPGQTFVWGVQDTAVGSITVTGTTSTSATVTAKTSGSGWVTAIACEKQGNLQIIVGEGNVATVTVSGTTTLQLGQAAVFTAKAYNRFGRELLDKIATWEVSPAPPLCNFTPSGISSARLTAQAPGIGTLTGTTDDVHGHLAITIITGTPAKLAITSEAQTISAGMVSAAVIVQAQNEFGAPVNVTSPMTVTVTTDSLLSRFCSSVSGAAWTSGTAATYVIPAGANSTSFYCKYNGTSTSEITITVNADNMTAATQSITVTALGTATAGTIIADDGRTMVTLEAGDLAGASFIEIDTNPASTGVNAPSGLVITAQTLRQINLIGAGLSSGATVTVTLPYSEGNLAGNSEDSIQPYRLGSGSTAWEKISGISRNTADNTVSAVVGSFSYFALMLPWHTDLKNVIAYPNPCITEKHGYQMCFANLTQNSTIKIFNIAGELVKEIAVDEPIEIWKIDNDDGERVSSGLYIYLITDPASNKKVGKLAVIK